MTTTVWVDGRFVGEDEPALVALDHGLTVGDGVFETLGVVDGVGFALTRHLARLARSAAGLGLATPDETLIRRAVAEVLAHAGDTAQRLRITVTGGVGPLGSGRTEGRQTVVVAASPGGHGPTSKVVRAPWVRNERSAVAGLKTTSYAENVVALAYAKERGADEAILANTVGELCEGTGANVFVERGGELVTPPLSSGCLAGITRALTLEWGAEVGLPVREAAPGELTFDVLDEVERGEAHLLVTGSVRNLTPVVELDGAPVEPGRLSQRLAQLFAARQRDLVDP
ncbi:aminotransferase class IV [Luteimicrobium subarcticum]|uniref:Branched-chain amino acid aminotransferase n=1 Tax=Luteimicrobium subarcticum TaxID=620910 RepID=A0A2M8W416_9MICO|nr:aminotransferase class IV [Luteimicrobium subarcticum]PJI85667.1 branched-chain amino acid aminotransferase [Luteimicrobium subarcticum]